MSDEVIFDVATFIDLLGDQLTVLRCANRCESTRGCTHGSPTVVVLTEDGGRHQITAVDIRQGHTDWAIQVHVERR